MLVIILDDRDIKIKKTAFTVYVIDVKGDKWQYCFESAKGGLGELGIYMNMSGKNIEGNNSMKY